MERGKNGWGERGGENLRHVSPDEREYTAAHCNA